MFRPVLLNDFFQATAQANPGKTALIFEEQRLPYSRIEQDAQRLALALYELGLRRQDRVAIFMDNCPQMAVALYATLKAGGIFVIVNGSIKAQKLRYVLKDSGASVLIASAEKCAVVQEALEDSAAFPLQLIWTGSAGEFPSLSLSQDAMAWEKALDGVDPNDTHVLEALRAGVVDADLAALIYTSGSTGEPKGIMCPHSSMVAAASSITQYLENRPEDIIINFLPMSFDYGLYQFLMSFMFGGTLVLERSFMYFHTILERMAAERVTGLPLVPTAAAMLLKMNDLSRYDLKSLRYITNTGAKLPEEHIRRMRKLFPDARIYSMYGLSECKRVSYLPPEEIDRRTGSVGKAMPNCEAYIADEAGHELPAETEGELVVRGANVMRGYWNDPERTARVFRPGRYQNEVVLHTGDLFRKDAEGFLYFAGRKDDLIKSRGERVGSQEVENAICAIEGVSEAAVVGIPDAILGQAIKAFVVLQPGVELTERQVLQQCAKRLEPVMTPRQIEFCDTLPRSPHGKIDKKALLQRHMDSLDAV